LSQHWHNLCAVWHPHKMSWSCCWAPLSVKVTSQAYWWARQSRHWSQSHAPADLCLCSCFKSGGQNLDIIGILIIVPFHYIVYHISLSKSIGLHIVPCTVSLTFEWLEIIIADLYFKISMKHEFIRKQFIF